jgi:hypothetical protein
MHIEDIPDETSLAVRSQEHSNGERVKLDLRNVSSFSIFPGQVSMQVALLLKCAKAL